jgi:hypothetical protein
MTGLLCGADRGGRGHCALLLTGLGIRLYYLAACADLRTRPGKHLGLSPASTTAVSPSCWQGSGKLALPGQAR